MGVRSGMILNKMLQALQYKPLLEYSVQPDEPLPEVMDSC